MWTSLQLPIAVFFFFLPLSAPRNLAHSFVKYSSSPLPLLLPSPPTGFHLAQAEMQSATAPSSLVGSSLFAAPRRGLLAPIYRAACGKRRTSAARVCCGAAAISTADASSSGAVSASGEALDGDALAASRVGARVRVKSSVKVYHVQKLPDLELQGLEGVIKQYVGLWKGTSISANLPFKVEFVLPDGAEGRPGPIKFVAHLREEEFEYLSQD